MIIIIANLSCKFVNYGSVYTFKAKQEHIIIRLIINKTTIHKHDFVMSESLMFAS